MLCAFRLQVKAEVSHLCIASTCNNNIPISFVLLFSRLTICWDDEMMVRKKKIENKNMNRNTKCNRIQNDLKRDTEIRRKTRRRMKHYGKIRSIITKETTWIHRNKQREKEHTNLFDALCKLLLFSVAMHNKRKQ